MEKFYKICCVVMGILTLAALGVTVYVGVTGASPTASRVGLIAVVVCLSLFAALTVLAIALFKIGGRLPYKIGFYILHAGVVVLLAGFIISGLGTVNNRSLVTMPDGTSASSSGDFFYVSFPRESVRVGNKSLLRAGENFLLESVKTEYYDDGMPKYYEATVIVYDRNTGVEKQRSVLTVNHPARISGFKVYLMSVQEDYGAVLLIKFDPGEYVILTGASLLVAGTFLACFSGFPKRKKKGGEAL